MGRISMILMYTLVTLGFLGLLTTAIVRSLSSSHQSLWGIVVPVAVGLALVFGITAARWLPGALAMRVLRSQRGSRIVFLCIRDSSILSLLDRYRTGGATVTPHLYSPIEVTETSLRVWAGGAAAEPVIEIPFREIASISAEFGPFHTITPIRYLELEFREGDRSFRFVPYGAGGLLPLSSRRFDTFAGTLAQALSVPIR